MKCKICKKEKIDNEFHICEQNFSWYIGDSMSLNFYVKKNIFNRFKWYVSTKLFLPGTYKWINK